MWFAWKQWACTKQCGIITFNITLATLLKNLKMEASRHPPFLNLSMHWTECAAIYWLLYVAAACIYIGHIYGMGVNIVIGMGQSYQSIYYYVCMLELWFRMSQYNYNVKLVCNVLSLGICNKGSNTHIYQAIWRKLKCHVYSMHSLQQKCMCACTWYRTKSAVTVANLTRSATRSYVHPLLIQEVL